MPMDSGTTMEIPWKSVCFPFFYQTRWFYFLCAGLAAVVLAGIYAWRVKHLKNKECALQ